MEKNFKDSLFYERLNNDKVKCNLCPHNCVIDRGQEGICTIRRNIDGSLKSINYGRVTALHLDPIEKKPLYHFYPGSNILSMGSYGCNFKCSFCQNYSIAHDKSDYIEVNIDNALNILSRYNDSENIGVAFTYNEPSIWYEYIEDISKELNKIGKKVVLVTNGYINEEPLRRLLPLIDGMNIDLKSFGQEFYRDICKGNINHVMKSIEIAAKECHVEITTLLIENMNTSEEEVEGLAKWISSINESIPLHLSRYFPAYNMTSPATSVETILRSHDIAKKYLEYAYIGNVMGVDRNTYCPKCGAVIVDRNRNVKVLNLKEGKCVICDKKINLIT